MFLDDAHKYIRITLQAALKEGNDALAIEKCLEDLKAADLGFSYKIAVLASDGSDCGYVYMTSIMRANWEQFGSVVFLDAMKRKTNNVHWPYLSVVMLDGGKKVCLACKAITCAERIDAYVWIMNCVFEMGPRRTRYEIRMLFCNGIFRGSTLLERLGIGVTCRLGIDEYHLLNEDWPKYFGAQAWTILEPLIRKCIYSRSNEDCEANFKAILQQVARNVTWVAYVEREVHCHRMLFVRCYIAEYEGTHLSSTHRNHHTVQCPPKTHPKARCHSPGNLERHGSSPSEANHASALDTPRLKNQLLPCS
jgi:hypothetical protein